VTGFAIKFFAKLMADKEKVRNWIDTMQSRLRSKYLAVKEAMDLHKLPYLQANAGLFVWLDLSSWLSHFDGSGELIHGIDAREVGLCKYLVSHGVYMTLGQVRLYLGCMVIMSGLFSC
jgi:DNA-binding transcriptional MocR family regulator